MDTVLDLDLDFFVWPIAHWRSGRKRRSEADCNYVASKEAVRGFLEQQCYLTTGSKLPGREVVEHPDAFRIWRQWLRDGRLSAPFRVIHVDAHADLGLGDPGWLYLTTDVLARPVARRSRS